MIETELRDLVYELLSPIKNPKCCRLYLELFDKHVLRLDMTADELDGAQIYGEYPTQFIGRTRYIDLAIITSRRFIPIEVKIEAGSGKSQCDDYLREAQLYTDKYALSESPVLYYLSPEGYFPSTESAKDFGYRGELNLVRLDKIDDVSFRSELLHWVEDCLSQTPKNFPCRKKLEQLRDEICSIIGKTDFQQQAEDIMRNFFTALDERFDEKFCKEHHFKRGSNRRAEIGDAYDYKRFIDRFFGKAFSWPSICLQCTDAKLDDDKELCFRVGCYNDRCSYLDESTAFCAGFMIFSHEVKQGLYKETDIKPLFDGKNILPQEFVDEYDKKFNGLVGRKILHDAHGNTIDFKNVAKTLTQFRTQEDIDAAVDNIMTEIETLLRRFVYG